MFNDIFNHVEDMNGKVHIFSTKNIINNTSESDKDDVPLAYKSMID